jgi:hypothetical protein
MSAPNPRSQREELLRLALGEGSDFDDPRCEWRRLFVGLPGHPGGVPDRDR